MILIRPDIGGGSRRSMSPVWPCRARWWQARRWRGRGAAVAVVGAPAPWVRSTRSVPTLPRGTRAAARRGPATVVRGDVVLKPRDPGALDAFDTAVSTPGSPTFRHYLGPGAVRGGVRAEPGDHRRRSGPGSRAGASMSAPTSGDGLIVPVSGTAAQIDQAFDVGLEQYRLPSGRIVRVPDAEPLVPSALAGAAATGSPVSTT